MIKNTKEDRRMYLNFFLFLAFMLGIFWQLSGEILLKEYSTWISFIPIPIFAFIWFKLLRFSEKVIIEK